MAGPTSSVIFSFIPSEPIWEEITNIILNISEKVEGDDFWVTSTKPINGTVINTTGRPFGIERNIIDSNYYYSEEEILKIENNIGFTPKFSLGIYAMSNQKIDHRILGELILYLAQKFNGIVNFHAAIYPYQSLPSKMKEGMWLWEKANWVDIKPYFEEMTEKIDGKIFSIEYKTANNRNWVYHLCNAEFLESWLQNKRFTMLK